MRKGERGQGKQQPLGATLRGREAQLTLRELCLGASVTAGESNQSHCFKQKRRQTHHVCLVWWSRLLAPLSGSPLDHSQP